MFIPTIVFTIIIVVAWRSYLGILQFIDNQAKKKEWLVAPREGEFIAVMKADTFHKFLYNIEGFHLNHETHDLKEGSQEPNLLFQLFGVEWIGPPPLYHVLHYPFSWIKSKTIKNADGTTKLEFDVREREIVTSILYRYTYAFIFRDVELKDNVRVTIVLYISIRTINPYKALFKMMPTGTWLETVRSYLEEVVTNYGRKVAYDDMKAPKQDESEAQSSNTDFTDSIIQLNTKTNGGGQGIREMIGVEIEGASYASFEREKSAQDKELEEALTAELVATEKGKALIATAKAKSAARDIDKNSEVQYYKEISQIPGAMELKNLEAVQKTNLLTYGGTGNTSLLVSHEQKEKTKENGTEEK